jgi:hypothetical protein
LITIAAPESKTVLTAAHVQRASARYRVNAQAARSEGLSARILLIKQADGRISELYDEDSDPGDYEGDCSR